MQVHGEDIVGQPIKGKPDHYAPGRGDKGFRPGAHHYPQGPDGPLFRKEHDGTWLHLAGNAASLAGLVNGPQPGEVGPKIG